MISGLFQSGCVFYLDSLSALTISQGIIANVSNVDTPGAFYIENSNVTINNLNFTNITSDIGYACLYAINSYTRITNSTFKYFKNGCFDIQKSSFWIKNTSFINNNIYNNPDIYASVIECIFCFYLSVDGCLFIGNQKNTLDGGVKETFFVFIK